MGFTNIDAPGHAVDRRGVRAIQRAAGSADRLAAAKARREAKAARRAAETAIVFSTFPKDEVRHDDPDGAYVQGGLGFQGGRYQIVVAGPLKGPVEDYRAALSAWLQKPFKIVSSETMSLFLAGPDEEYRRQWRANYEARGPFLSIILEPATE